MKIDMVFPKLVRPICGLRSQYRYFVSGPQWGFVGTMGTDEVMRFRWNDGNTDNAFLKTCLWRLTSNDAVLAAWPLALGMRTHCSF